MADFVLNKIHDIGNQIYSYSKNNDKIYRTVNEFQNYNLLKIDIQRDFNFSNISYFQNLFFSITTSNVNNKQIENVKITPYIEIYENPQKLDSFYTTDSVNIIKISNKEFDFYYLISFLKLGTSVITSLS